MKQRENQKMKLATIAAILAVSALGVTGGTAAYLTDHKEVKNAFVVGRVEIETLEPDYKPDEHGETPDLVPGQEITKNPLIANVGKNDAFVYMDVSIPIAKVVTTEESGERANGGNAVDTELFTQEGLQLSTEGKLDGWHLMYQERSGDAMVYVYNYDQILHPGDQTRPLFSSVTFANLLEGQLDEKKLEIPVRSYAIQTLNTSDGEGSVRDQALQAWKTYWSQNKEDDGAMTAQLEKKERKN